ncbi:uncharacterized protein CXorf38 isoform X2 [Hypomesus transpacificus]|uniref:uncharacterized protein CXorf38 isoform X2 n=1 Tax=Hypomesus transpacificus TaxID=137520 RepID=UPI001F080EB6|nr:uncharacterized protein CXorf38 isoform X2 [Hypomesus transpacificus]
MVHHELTARLNDGGYKNWLKAGICLLHLREGLHAFTNREMRRFHENLLNRNQSLRRPCQRSCRPKNNQLYSECVVCAEWRSEILKHHTHPAGTVNWGNCRPQLWSQDHWELAKAYMPRGQTGEKGSDKCDASALLNLLNYCDHFSYIDQERVRKVIHCRNELMHSCGMQVGDEWMRRYKACLERLLQLLTNVPEVAAANQQIHKTLTAEWSVCVSGVDQVDMSGEDRLEIDCMSQWEIEAGSISQWEVELLRERLQEVQFNADAQFGEMQSLREFLLANPDLGEQLSPELLEITSLGRKRKREEQSEPVQD